MNLLDKPKSWPQVPARDGESYGVEDPVHKGYQLAVMTMKTWLDFGTKFEVQRRTLEAQNSTIRELQVTHDVLVKQLADLKTRHENLREAVRKERTEKILNPTKGTVK